MIFNETVVTKPDWISLQGTTLDGGYELGDVLELHEAFAHFKTRVLGDALCRAYTSFFAAEGLAALEQLQVWESLRKLRHPNLKAPLGSGRLRVHGVEVIYVILAMPDETLSEILTDRALTDDEGSELLKSLGQGLAHLHANGFVHGCVSPETTVAVGDNIQLSTEAVRRINTVPKVQIAKPRYLAPEASVTNVTVASDIWCLGAGIFESLVQRKYETPWFADLERLGLGEILRRCLDANPRTRCKLSELLLPVGINPSPGANGSYGANGTAARATQTFNSPRLTRPIRQNLETKRIGTFGQADMDLVKFDPTVAAQQLRVRVKTGRTVWRPVVAAIGAVLVIVLFIWLVILPKFQAPQELVDAAPNAPPRNAWPTKTLAASDAANADARVTQSASAVAPPETSPVPSAAGPNETVPPVGQAKTQDTGPATWRVVLGSYAYLQDAERRIQLINKTHPGLNPKQFALAPGGPFFVVVGDAMTHTDAVNLRRKALEMGISRASYVGNFK